MALAVAPLCFLPALALASSHGEAPFVKGNPRIDATDFYMFNSYEAGRDGYVTLVANYYPLQDAYGGPNFFTLDPSALYQIHIDNNGDGKEDLTFSFGVTNTNRDISLNIGSVPVPIPLINAGMIGPAATANANLNVVETYGMYVIRGDRYTGTASPVTNTVGGSAIFTKPVDNIGSNSIPNYETYVRNHIYNINLPGSVLTGRMFVGQRKDPFVVNLGPVFDLVNLNPLGPENGGKDDLADKNVTSFVLEIPAAYLRNASGETVIGGWTTASLQRARVLTPTPTFGKPASYSGGWIQASRLGMPLVNELVIGLRDKDKFNASAPTGDGQFINYVTNPTLPALLASLFGVTAPCLPRNDLVSVFLTGVPGLNQPANVVGSEMTRLNTNTDPSAGGIPAKPKGSQSRLGVLAGDTAGFPNGRRPGDDVVDIELRVVMGVLYPDAGVAGGCAPQGTAPFTDGAFVDDSFFDNVFPYLRAPLGGVPAAPASVGGDQPVTHSGVVKRH
ncbi:MAG: DUF4331 domain-containing protein [Phycisphaerales bacterium]